MSKLLSLIIVVFALVACSSNTDPKEEMPSSEIEDSVSLSNTNEDATTTIPQESVEESIVQKNSSTIVAQTVAHHPITKEKNTSSKTNISPKTTEPKTDQTLEDVTKKEETFVNTNTTPEPKAESAVEDNVNNKPPRPTLSHDIFNELLGKYVSSSGAVDYEGFKANKTKLTQYLELLKNNPPESSWSKNKEMAYWINLYNAITIHSIVEKYPVNSVMDLEGGKVWDKKKIEIKGESLTLNIIEKEKLLKKFKEPRVHFAVNCAAASCPPLLNKAWEEDNIQRYFDQQAKAFVNNKKYNELSSKSIAISQIFNWYASDFGGSEKVLAYIQKYSETTISNSAKVSFKEYDWTLNKK